jgi:hypothetical protein
MEEKMNEKKEVRKIELVGGGLTKEESRKVFGGEWTGPECLCINETLSMVIRRSGIQVD